MYKRQGCVWWLLQVLDDGRLTDSKGRLVNFKNTVIILTSNVGSEQLINMNQIGFDDALKKSEEKQKSQDEVREKVMGELQKSFRPEFLNRLDEIIVFKQLDQRSITRIVSLLIDGAMSNLLEKGITVQVDRKVIDKIGKEGYDAKYGARPLHRKIQTDILNPLANAIIDGNIKEGALINVSVDDGKYVFSAPSKKSTAKRKKEKVLACLLCAAEMNRR